MNQGKIVRILLNLSKKVHETGKTMQQSAFFHFSSIFTPRPMRDWKNRCLGMEKKISAPRHPFFQSLSSSANERPEKLVPRPGKV